MSTYHVLWLMEHSHLLNNRNNEKQCLKCREWAVRPWKRLFYHTQCVHMHLHTFICWKFIQLGDIMGLCFAGLHACERTSCDFHVVTVYMFLPEKTDSCGSQRWLVTSAVMSPLSWKKYKCSCQNLQDYDMFSDASAVKRVILLRKKYISLNYKHYKKTNL